MVNLKILETELILDWQNLQAETDSALKAIALKAYNIKYKLFKKSQAWSLEMNKNPESKL